MGVSFPRFEATMRRGEEKPPWEREDVQERRKESHHGPGARERGSEGCVSGAKSCAEEAR